MSTPRSRAALTISWWALPIVLAAPVVLGARGCGSDEPIGTDTCAADSCGPPLGAPAIECWDGTIGGNTGVCRRTADGTCGWEIRECPAPEECTELECGAAPSAPATCRRDADGTCRWVPEDPGGCEVAECGPTPGTPSWVCDDGRVGGFTGRCLRDAAGVCGWEIVDCPRTEECTLAECGPALGAPACLCADGSIGCNTGRCLRGADGMCGWEWRECPSTVVCGGFPGTPCPAGQFCRYAREDICGAADATGVCSVPPTGCPTIYMPVCGCDGMTYGNECEANAAGTSVSSEGVCGGPSCRDDATCDDGDPSTRDECDARGTCTHTRLCGGFAGWSCRSGEFCDYAEGDGCGIADGLGQCRQQPDPSSCGPTDGRAQVCGCDGRTYPSQCHANALGISVLHTGPC